MWQNDTENIYPLNCSNPEKYVHLKLPSKLPPMKVTIPVRELPLPGYLEQTVAYALRTALATCAAFRPKYPFISPERSALIYTALQLKGRLCYLAISCKHLTQERMVSFFPNPNLSHFGSGLTYANKNPNLQRS